MFQPDGGRNLEEIRRTKMFTQEELAAAAGVSPTTISGIESGKISRPQSGTLRKLGRVLGVSPERFFTLERRGGDGSSNVSLQQARSLDPEDFEDSLDEASLEDLEALSGELEVERRHLRALYGDLHPESGKRRQIKRQIREIAAHSASVSLSIEFYHPR